MLNKETKNKKAEEDLTMKLRSFMAGALAATLVAGSSVVAFAADDNTGTATGTGTSVGHVDKEVLTVTLPTNTDSVFNYWVDPERVIDLAGSLSDGTAVVKNEDGVYFKKSDNTYASTSNDVEFEGKNSVAVDVSVAAEVEATAGDKDIALVADEAALTAATTPALLMKLTVGTDTKAITSEGATAKAKLDGVPDNFEVKVDGGVYKYSAKTGATGWAKTAVKLSGKTNKMDIPSDMTAPSIKLTWTIVKHEEYTDATAHGNWSGGTLWLAKDASTGFSTTGLIVEVSDGGTTYKTLASDKYDINEAGWVSTTWDNIVAGIGDTPSGTAYVRITDGNTRYTYENK